MTVAVIIDRVTCFSIAISQEEQEYMERDQEKAKEFVLSHAVFGKHKADSIYDNQVKFKLNFIFNFVLMILYNFDLEIKSQRLLPPLTKGLLFVFKFIVVASESRTRL